MSDHVEPALGEDEFILSFDAPERIGIVHAVSGILVEHGLDIVESRQFDDRRSGRFFMRLHVAAPAGAVDEDAFRSAIAGLEASLGLRWRLRRAGATTRVLIMVSRFDHCLNDLLYRARTGELPIEVVAVVSNHKDHAGLAGWHSVPFFHVPVTPETKPEAEAKLLEIADRFDAELIVLARYMQVLSNELSTALSGRCINIHHSFLPSFKGAKPYHQAYDRGVKVVGATAHYVDEHLDEGPIISQSVIPVDHAATPEDLVAIGRDAEVRALTDAVRAHCEDRVFLNGTRTVVLR